MIEINTIYNGDCLEVLNNIPDDSIDCCVTSPPYYGLRDYGVDGQIGLEETPEQYVEKMVRVFSHVKRCLKPEGTLWLNLGDSYSGSGKGIGSDHGKAVFTDGDIKKTNWSKTGLKPKDLIGIPWMVAFALRADGWYLRQDIIWHKPNPMPESVTDRCTKSHEYIFLMSKSQRYYYDSESIQEKSVTSGIHTNNKYTETDAIYGGTHKNPNAGLKKMVVGENKNKRSVWTINTKPYTEAHFATFPEKLIVDCIKAGCPEGGVVLDPFMGAGTTAIVARKLNRNYVGIELNPKYIEIADKRILNEIGLYK